MSRPAYENPLPPGYGLPEVIDKKRALFRSAVTWYLISYLVFLLSLVFHEPGTAAYARILGVVALAVGLYHSAHYWHIKADLAARWKRRQEKKSK